MQTVNMVVLWVTLLLLHQSYSLVPVITVEVNKPVTFTCVLPDGGLSSKQLLWYKQSVGDMLQLIATLKKSTKPVFGPEFTDGRLEGNLDTNISNLTIQRTISEDEGMYHCAVVDWTFITWTGMYLSVKERTSNYSVVQTSTVSDPDHPGDSVTLQCSVLSDSGNKTCPGGLSVYWFRAASDASAPGIISTDGNSKCEQRSESVKSCRYRFSTVSSSDAGTYLCAVATCGRILFGEGTKLQIGQMSRSELLALVTLTVGFVISLIVNIVFICCRTPRSVCQQFKETENVSLRATLDVSSQPRDIAEDGRDVSYAAFHFSTRGRKKLKSEDSLYSQVKTSS